MKLEIAKHFVADFETTVYDGQKETEVWSAAIVELFRETTPENVTVLGSMDDFLSYLRSMKKNCILWFHNLRFDGSFIVDHLLRKGYEHTNIKDSLMRKKQFKTLISEQQRWYSVKIKFGKHMIEFRDSAKMAPLTVEQCGDAYKTKYRKLTMEYKGRRYAHCPISPIEMDYIKNDVLVMKEVMEHFYLQGFTSLTIGSCCVKVFKEMFNDWAMGNEKLYDAFFPDLKQYKNFDLHYFNCKDAFEYTYRFYKGAWCYKNPAVRKVDEPGIIVDKTSMYPSHMDSTVHRHPYAIGLPTFFKGKPPQDKLDSENYVVMVQLKCQFKLKPRHFPMIQIKNSFLYKGNVWRENSKFDISDRQVAKCIKAGKIVTPSPTLYLSEPEYRLFLESYDIWDDEYIGGCYYRAVYGIFDDYVERFRKEKETTTGGKRTIAKLCSNGFYGKLATSDDSSYLIPVLNKERDCLDFDIVVENKKDTFAIQSGLLVTAYARVDMVTTANRHYDRFNYGDTDSMHLSGLEEPDVEIHPTKYGAWKIEGRYRRAVYLRQKTYAEELINTKYEGLLNEKQTDEFEWNITCAGMPNKSKKMFVMKYDPWEDFCEGTQIGGKLVPKRIHGGTILEETTFTIHE